MATSAVLAPRRHETIVDSTSTQQDRRPATSTEQNRRSLANVFMENMNRLSSRQSSLIPSSPIPLLTNEVAQPQEPSIQARTEALIVASSVKARVIHVQPKPHIPEELQGKIENQIELLRCLSNADKLPLILGVGESLERFKASLSIATHHMDVIEDAVQTLSVESQRPVLSSLESCKKFFDTVDLNLNIIEENLKRLALSEDKPPVMYFRPGFGKVAYAVATAPVNAAQSRKILEGSFGVTSLVVHEDPNKTHYVVKRPLSQSKYVMDLFNTETNTNYSLPDHPGVMEFFGVIKEGDRQGHLLGYIPGGELFDAIMNDTLRSNEKYNIAEKLAAAVNAIHASGLIHCDLKPENIMLTYQLNPKMIDFGLARPRFEIDDIPWKIGTVEYMAPEMLFPGRTIDNKIDTWSYGYTLYCMLTARFFWDDVFAVYGKTYPEDSAVKILRQFITDNQTTLQKRILFVIANLEDELKETTSLSTRQINKLCLVLQASLELNPEDRDTMQQISTFFTR